MKSALNSRKMMCHLLSAGALCLAFAFAANAQVETTTKTAAAGPPTTTVSIERGEVVYVSGNSVVVKKDDGQILHFDNVPETTTVTVDGKQLNVHQLQAGMKVERQTITTVVPKTITTVKTVTGTVWQVNPPKMVILTMPNGKNQRFTIPEGQKFKVADRRDAVDAFGLRKGMRIDAQQVTESSQTEVEQQVKRTGVMPPPPAPAPDVPILVVYVPVPVQTASAPAPAAAEPAPTQLPKTGSDFPLFGLLGAISIALGLGLKAVRTRTA